MNERDIKTWPLLCEKKAKTPHTYYKVVRALNKKLVSCNSYESTTGQVRYTKNKWATPKKGRNQWLYVFGNLADAERFIYSVCWNEVKIYECEIGNVLMMNIDAPKGTVFVDKVKITKKVK